MAVSRYGTTWPGLAAIEFPDLDGPLVFQAPREVLAAYEAAQVRDVIDSAEAAALAGAFVVGFVSYEAAPAFGLPAQRGGAGPLVWFGVYDAPARDIAVPLDLSPVFVGPTSANRDRDGYRRDTAAIRAAIARGDTYETNLTMRLSGHLFGSPWSAWRGLCAAQGQGWFAYVDTGGQVIASASPELFFSWDRTRLQTRPMKGTRARGLDPSLDAARRADLLANPKDRAENLMIVDLLRNDLHRVCLPGTVSTDALLAVEEHPTVWQLTSSVSGLTRPDARLVDVFEALFPCGSVTGVPKPRTMALIGEVEARGRGAYCGAVGVIRPGGSATFNVAIRTMTLGRDGSFSYDVGGAVVWDSDPDQEWQEARDKALILDRLRAPVAAPGMRLLETFLAVDGAAPRLEAHLARLAWSAAVLGWFFDPAAVSAEVLAALVGSEGRQRVRLLYDARGRLDIQTAALTGPIGAVGQPGPAAVVGVGPAGRDPAYAVRTPGLGAPAGVGPGRAVVAGSGVPVDSGEPMLRIKTDQRQDYESRAAAHPGCFDVLLVNERGEVTEFTRGNVFARIDGALWTPPLACGLLPGILRAELLAAGAARTRVLTMADLRAADEVWFGNSLRGLIRVDLA